MRERKARRRASLKPNVEPPRQVSAILLKLQLKKQRRGTPLACTACLGLENTRSVLCDVCDGA